MRPTETIQSKGRILYLTQLFDPEPTFKGLEFVKALMADGYETEVVTGFPNYPGGKVYDGYRVRLLKKEQTEGVDITRLAMYPSHDRNAVKRILCYASFMITSFFYMLFGAKRASLVYVFYPSLTAGLAAIGAKLFRRTPVIIDIQDMWPDSLSATGMLDNSAVLRTIGKLCTFLYRRADHIIVLSEGFKELLVERGVQADKISVIPNWAEETALPEQRVLPSAFNTDDSFRLLFAGNMGAAQGLETALDAAKIVAQTHPSVRLYFMGAGLEVETLKKKSADMGLENVEFIPRVPLEEVQEYLAAADCLLVHLKDNPLFRVTIPSKTQAYMYAGKPIIMAVQGNAADMVVEAGAGFACQPENPQALAQSVLDMIELGPEKREAMGKQGRAYYDENLSLQKSLVAFSKLVERVKR